MSTNAVDLTKMSAAEIKAFIESQPLLSPPSSPLLLNSPATSRAALYQHKRIPLWKHKRILSSQRKTLRPSQSPLSGRLT
jgi:hypothetical protein